jgi:hypothetical protein
LDSIWCGIGSCTETCWTAEQIDDTLGLALLFLPAENEIWLAQAEAISEDFVETAIIASYTQGRTFVTFNIPAFPSVVLPRDPCTPSDLPSDDIRIALWWNNNADIDLHVTDPNGEEIYFGNPTSASGGELDLDARCDSFPEGSGGGPEHVTWGSGLAIAGEYTVEVDYWAECFSEGDTQYSVIIYVGGTKIFETTDAVISPDDETAFVTNFNF